MISPFFNGFVVRTISSWVMGSSVWFVLGTQSWQIKYASGNKALADVPFRPPTSKQFVSKIPQIVWISSSLNCNNFHWFLMRLTIISWFRFQRAGIFLPWNNKWNILLLLTELSFLLSCWREAYGFHYALPFRWAFSMTDQINFLTSSILWHCKNTEREREKERKVKSFVKWIRCRVESFSFRINLNNPTLELWLLRSRAPARFCVLANANVCGDCESWRTGIRPLNDLDRCTWLSKEETCSPDSCSATWNMKKQFESDRSQILTRVSYWNEQSISRAW